jgi:hypothetical protein
MKHIFTKAIVCMVTLLLASSLWAQDIIVTTDSKKIEAKILEVSDSEIKYKEKEYLDGPTFVMATNKISSVLYANGKVVLYNQSPADEKKEEQQQVQAMPEQQVIPSAPSIDDNTAEVLLLSGNTITVQITEMKSNYIAYIMDGKPYTWPTSQISKITFLTTGQVKTYEHYTVQEDKQEDSTPKNSTNNKKYPRYQGYLELSGLFENVLGYTCGGIGFDGVDGGRINKYVFLGAGLGIYAQWGKFPLYYDGNTVVVGSSAYSVEASVATVEIPIFADLRIYIPTKTEDCYPYFETSIGPIINFYQRVSTMGIQSITLNVNTLAFFRLNAGIDYKRFTFGVGYELWGNSSETDHMGFIKLGVRIGSDK